MCWVFVCVQSIYYNDSYTVYLERVFFSSFYVFLQLIFLKIYCLEILFFLLSWPLDEPKIVCSLLPNIANLNMDYMPFTIWKGPWDIGFQVMKVNTTTKNTKNLLLRRSFQLVMICPAIFSSKSSKANIYAKEITRNLNIKSFCIKDTEIRVTESYMTSG